MCRYVAYLGEPLLLANVLYGPSNGLIHQASAAMESRTRINADGFGIGWYNPDVSPEPAVFRDISPAWNNENLRSLANTETSTCILAHVRAARRFDPVNRSNCHPFHSGRLLWMHNGDIPGRARLHRRVVSRVSDELVSRIVGNTDSELAFVLFLHLLGETSLRPCSSNDLAAAMTGVVEQIVEWWRQDADERPLALNFCVASGSSIVALRFGLNVPEVPTLHYCRGSHFVCENGLCSMRSSAAAPRSVMLASETLSDDPLWESLENGALLVVHDSSSVETRSLRL